MADEKDTLPSDAEKGSLKPRDTKDREPPTPPPENEKAKEDPSEQPS